MSFREWSPAKAWHPSREARMTEWSTLFDEAYKVAGASAADIDRFVATVGQPLGPTEVKAAIDIQRNPFSKGDPLYASWRPFDPSAWVVPNRPLPPSYLELLSWSNGGEFRTGERWFQFFPILHPRHGVRAILLAYELPQYMPGAIPFAFNGAGTFYLLDMRRAAEREDYPIVCSHAGNLGWDMSECVQIATSFEAACRGTVNVDELLYPETS
jgi:hypothetical protein